MGKAYAQAGDINKSRVSFSLAEKLLEGENHNLTVLGEDKLEAEEVAIEAMNNKKLIENPTLSRDINPDLSSASSLIKVETNKTKNDRFIVAAEQIQAGDTLLVEEPVCACILPKNFGTHCYDCFTRLTAPYNCYDCSGVAFCSPECRDRAFSTYHKYECQYLDLLVGSGMSILCFTALRMILQTQNNPEKLKEVKTILQNLCQHADIRKPHDYFQRTLMTTFILRFLQHSGFFGRRTTESVEPTKKELEVGVLILGLLQALQFNAHEIFETKLGQNHRISGSKLVYIGVGIYKTGSLFNHECDFPSVIRSFMGKKMIFNASHPHKKGDLVTENYGPIFTKKSFQERQRALKGRYWFTCQCKACVENWPLLDTLKDTARFKCPTENCSNILIQLKKSEVFMKCGKCKQKVNLGNSIDVVHRASELYRQGAEYIEVRNAYFFQICNHN